MSGDSFRTRKNGLIELRFRFDNKMVSVYGRTKEECMQRKETKKKELVAAKFCSQNDPRSVFSCCVLYCEQMKRDNKVHGYGYSSLMKTARFIGRHDIGNVCVDHLNDELIEQFRSDVSAYSVHTVRRAVFMLINIMKGYGSYGKKEVYGKTR